MLAEVNHTHLLMPHGLRAGHMAHKPNFSEENLTFR
jgi:hypothetical protein